LHGKNLNRRIHEVGSWRLAHASYSMARLTSDSTVLTSKFVANTEGGAPQAGAAVESPRGTALSRWVMLIGGAGYIGVPPARRLVETVGLVRTLDRLVYQNGSSLLGQAPEPASEFVFGDMGDGAALDGVTDVGTRADEHGCIRNTKKI
jgi:hypothetical protein